MDSITLVIPRNRHNYYKYVLFLSKLQLIYNFNVISDNQQSEIDITQIKTKYTLIYKRYCYIDFKKLSIILKDKKHKTFGLVNQSIALCETKTIKSKKGSIENIIKHILVSNKTQDLTKYCYLSNIQTIGCDYNRATFVCLNDNDKDFDNWLNEFHNKTKNIYYNGENYELKIGKTFFIKSFFHIGVLPNNKIIYWNNDKGRWVLANKKIMNLFQKKHRRISL